MEASNPAPLKRIGVALEIIVKGNQFQQKKNGNIEHEKLSWNAFPSIRALSTGVALCLLDGFFFAYHLERQ